MNPRQKKQEKIDEAFKLFKTTKPSKPAPFLKECRPIKKRVSPQKEKLSDVCDKLPYKTKEDAMVSLNRSRDKEWFNKGKKAEKKVCRVYICPICERWHLTRKK